jgi:hypothetical protein
MTTEIASSLMANTKDTVSEFRDDLRFVSMAIKSLIIKPAMVSLDT